jgi:Mor family transcriptional regulator
MSEHYSPQGLYRVRVQRGMSQAASITKAQETAFWTGFDRTQHLNMYFRQLVSVIRNLRQALRGEPADANAGVYRLALPIYTKPHKNLEGKFIISDPFPLEPTLVFGINPRRKKLMLLSSEGLLDDRSYAPTHKQRKEWARDLREKKRAMAQEYADTPRTFRKKMAELVQPGPKPLAAMEALRACQDVVTRRFPEHKLDSLEVLLNELCAASRDKAIERVRLYDLPFRDGIHHNGNGNENGHGTK